MVDVGTLDGAIAVGIKEGCVEMEDDGKTEEVVDTLGWKRFVGCVWDGMVNGVVVVVVDVVLCPPKPVMVDVGCVVPNVIGCAEGVGAVVVDPKMDPPGAVVVEGAVVVPNGEFPKMEVPEVVVVGAPNPVPVVPVVEVAGFPN